MEPLSVSGQRRARPRIPADLARRIDRLAVRARSAVAVRARHRGADRWLRAAVPTPRARSIAVRDVSRARSPAVQRIRAGDPARARIPAADPEMARARGTVE